MESLQPLTQNSRSLSLKPRSLPSPPFHPPHLHLYLSSNPRPTSHNPPPHLLVPLTCSPAAAAALLSFLSLLSPFSSAATASSASANCRRGLSLLA